MKPAVPKLDLKPVSSSNYTLSGKSRDPSKANQTARTFRDNMFKPMTELKSSKTFKYIGMPKATNLKELLTERQVPRPPQIDIEFKINENILKNIKVKHISQKQDNMKTLKKMHSQDKLNTI